MGQATQHSQRRGRFATAGGAKTANEPVEGARHRLKRSARQLFAERGFDGTALRDILVMAREKNGASVSYYFGSKEELIEEVIFDLFKEFDDRWSERLRELEASADIRKLVEVIVEVWLDRESTEPTIARLSEFATVQRPQVVRSIMKRHRLTAYDRILALISRQMPDMPANFMRQRLVFFTRYLSNIFSLYEATIAGGSLAQKSMLQINCDVPNVVDTAIGLLCAPVSATEN